MQIRGFLRVEGRCSCSPSQNPSNLLKWLQTHHTNIALHDVKIRWKSGEKTKILVRGCFWCNKVIIGLIYGRNLFALDLVDFLFGGNCSDIRFPATSYFPYKDTSFRGGFIWRGILYGGPIFHIGQHYIQRRRSWPGVWGGRPTDWGGGVNIIGVGEGINSGSTDQSQGCIMGL